MIIWVNGSFGAGKTTLTEVLLPRLPDSMIYDPEHVGFMIHRFVPEARDQDFQSFPMWRRLVVQFALEFHAQFKKNLIIPMSLVDPSHLQEIFPPLQREVGPFFHFFLEASEETLRQRITHQVLVPDNTEKDQRIRQWRLDQVSRCVAGKAHMPEGTQFLDALKTPEELVEEVIQIAQ